MTKSAIVQVKSTFYNKLRAHFTTVLQQYNENGWFGY